MAPIGSQPRLLKHSCRPFLAVAGALVMAVIGAVAGAVDCRARDGYLPRSKTQLERVMTESEILAEFRTAEALLQGHFVLSSGKHSANISSRADKAITAIL